MTDPGKERRILLGQIVTAHGIRGEVLVRSYAADPADIASYGPLSDESGKRQFQLCIVRVTDKGVIARVDGIADRTAAEALRGQSLFISRSKLPNAGASEFYHADLIGLDAVRPDGSRFGTVRAVHNFGAGDLLEITLADGASSEFVPFTDACVPRVDLDTGTITVIPPVMTGEAEPNAEESD